MTIINNCFENCFYVAVLFILAATLAGCYTTINEYIKIIIDSLFNQIVILPPKYDRLYTVKTGVLKWHQSVLIEDHTLRC